MSLQDRLETHNLAKFSLRPMNPALKEQADFDIRQKELHESGGLAYMFLGKWSSNLNIQVSSSVL